MHVRFHLKKKILPLLKKKKEEEESLEISKATEDKGGSVISLGLCVMLVGSGPASRPLGQRPGRCGKTVKSISRSQGW